MSKLEFKSIDSYTVTGRGVVYAVKNPAQCNDFAHIKGHDVLIDGKDFHVSGVEFFAHTPPWREGEPIGLLTAAPT